MVYDCIIIGAGPAGLSAAIYLGRANKKTLLVYGGPRRTALAAHIQNYLGFIDVSGPELLNRGMEQAEKYGVKIIVAAVKKTRQKDETFEIDTAEGMFSARNIVAASGIDDVLPDIDNIYEFIGETFYTCLDCDGYHLIGRRVCIIGQGDGTARTALAAKQLYTDKIAVCAGEDSSMGEGYLNRLQREDIRLIQKNAVHINGKNGVVESVILDDDSILECDCILSDMGYARNDSFLSDLQLERSRDGFIKVDENYESSVKRLYVVGPLNTGPDQVSVAVGEGARCAMHIVETELSLSP